MAKVDFISLSNIIFKDKDKYKYVSDEEKETNFFILNRKFAIKYLKQAQFFNNKNINKASAIDIWYQIFKNTINTPQWWWKTKVSKKEKPDFSKDDIKLLKEYHNITDNDIDFLIKYEKEKLKLELKRIKKFNGKK